MRFAMRSARVCLWWCMREMGAFSLARLRHMAATLPEDRYRGPAVDARELDAYLQQLECGGLIERLDHPASRTGDSTGDAGAMPMWRVRADMREVL